MKKAARTDWSYANHEYLMAALGLVRANLERLAHGVRAKAKAAPLPTRRSAERKLAALAAAMTAPPALLCLEQRLGLTRFERDVVLLAAGPELDSTFTRACGAAVGAKVPQSPTFSLALAALPEAHWDAFSPVRPLHHWRVLERESGAGLMTARLRLSARVLHYLTGANYVDEEAEGIVSLICEQSGVLASQRDLAARIASLLGAGGGKTSVIQLCGRDLESMRPVAAAACAAAGSALAVMQVESLPLAPAAVESLSRLWQRENLLTSVVLLVEDEFPETPDPERRQALRSFLEHTHAPILLATPHRQPVRGRATIHFDVVKPGAAEQVECWRTALGDLAGALNGDIHRIAGRFDLDAPIIRAVCSDVVGRLLPADEIDPAALVWDMCRVHSRPALGELATRVEAAAGWDQLVLPAKQRKVLRTIAAQAKHKHQVQESWGWNRDSRGLGISVLFAGPTGCGKTMAAEILAAELRLDLFRIDLSTVVNKYIGETEKNLRRIFDAAESGGAVLLFDEADALFGKRTEVKDSHDRYANLEVSYLLQRMEAYRGLAILSTNLKDTLDRAFLRRLRFVVNFPFPNLEERAAIWARIFPPETPTAGLDLGKLAQLSAAGGTIRNIALNATFLAADEGAPVRMEHLLTAAQMEYDKLERPLTTAETGGWVCR